MHFYEYNKILKRISAVAVKKSDKSEKSVKSIDFEKYNVINLLINETHRVQWYVTFRTWTEIGEETKNHVSCSNFIKMYRLY